LSSIIYPDENEEDSDAEETTVSVDKDINDPAESNDVSVKNNLKGNTTIIIDGSGWNFF
jgi:hypothetical protein